MRYEKDEINFRVFLNMLRHIHNVTLGQLSEGLYTESAFRRVEIGERIPEKLMRDRIMTRMGVSSENYQDYLQNDEYDRWKLRQSILNCVERKQWAGLEQFLNIYGSYEERSVVEEQFLATMWLWLYRNRNDEIELLQKQAEKAVSLTMPNAIKEFPEKMLLADQELELLVEYVDLQSDTNPDDIAWKLQQYEAILSYIEGSRMDQIGKAKIYPKAAVSYCNLILKKVPETENVCHGIQICNRGITLLQDTNRLYYFVELLEIKIQLLELITVNLSDNGKKKDIDEIAQWLEVVKGVYEEYHICPYMENDSHIFREPKCDAISDVIKRRRIMFGMSRAKLCDNICSDRALMRLENKNQKKAQMPIVRELFERLGLCAEYTRARVVTSDFEVIQLAEKTAIYTNGSEMASAEECLNQLEERLCMNIPCNKQVIKGKRCSLEYRKNDITLDEYFKRLEDALECTLPLKRILESDTHYMTQEEISCVYNIGVRLHNPDNPYIPIIKKICDEYAQEDIVASRIGEYELLMTGMANYLGTMERYDESDAVSKTVLKNCLQNRRMSSLATNIYNQVWNFRHRKINNLPIKQYYEEEVELEKCIMLANIAKSFHRQKFYRYVLEDWKRKK